MTLRDAISMAGGFTEFAVPEIVVKHVDGTMHLYKWTPEKQLLQNPLLRPGDKVINPRN